MSTHHGKESGHVERPKSIIDEVRRLLPDRLLFSGHAEWRKGERKILNVDIEYVLGKTGSYLPDRDRDSEEDGPTYTIEGTTVDGVRLRIVVCFKEYPIVPDRFVKVITVIDLSARK